MAQRRYQRAAEPGSRPHHASAPAGSIPVMAGPDDVAALAAAVGLAATDLRRADVEAQLGLPHSDLVRMWRAMGFAEVPEDEPAFGPEDVFLAGRLAELVESGRLDDREVLRLARVMGAAFSRVAEAQVGLLEDAQDRTEVDVTRDAELLALLERSLVHVWRRHLLAALGRRLRVDDSEDDELASTTTVGFVDIAGFSSLSRRLEVDDLAELVDGFEAAALQAVADHDGRVVKFIGDAVMYVAPDLDAGVRIGLDLQELAADADVPADLHCGVAIGPTVTMGGDVFGPTVNLASRLTDVARRGTVVVTRDSADVLGEDPSLVVRNMRRAFDLKGIGRTRLSTVARAGTSAPTRRRKA